MTEPSTTRPAPADRTRDIRKVFGLFAGILLLVGLLQIWWDHLAPAWIFLGLAALLAILVAAAPRVLLPLFRVYEPAALAIGRFNTRFFMFLTFYLIISPLSLILRLFGRDALALRRKRGEPSGWWKVEDQSGTDRERFRKQF